jgi:hypothetical protein
MIESNARCAHAIRHASFLILTSSPYYTQDDFDDLCDALTDRLGPISPTLLLPARPLPPSDGHISSSLANHAVPCSKAAETASAACRGAAQALPTASRKDTPPLSAQAADLARLAAELQTLETGRLRQGLDRLLALTEASTRRPGFSPREVDLARPGACSRPLCSAAGAGDAGEQGAGSLAVRAASGGS